VEIIFVLFGDNATARQLIGAVNYEHVSRCRRAPFPSDRFMPVWFAGLGGLG
jgi:hypothetical protein